MARHRGASGATSSRIIRAPASATLKKSSRNVPAPPPASSSRRRSSLSAGSTMCAMHTSAGAGAIRDERLRPGRDLGVGRVGARHRQDVCGPVDTRGRQRARFGAVADEDADAERAQLGESTRRWGRLSTATTFAPSALNDSARRRPVSPSPTITVWSRRKRRRAAAICSRARIATPLRAATAATAKARKRAISSDDRHRAGDGSALEEEQLHVEVDQVPDGLRLRPRGVVLDPSDVAEHERDQGEHADDRPSRHLVQRRPEHPLWPCDLICHHRARLITVGTAVMPTGCGARHRSDGEVELRRGQDLAADLEVHAVES